MMSCLNSFAYTSIATLILAGFEPLNAYEPCAAIWMYEVQSCPKKTLLRQLLPFENLVAVLHWKSLSDELVFFSSKLTRIEKS